MPRLPALPFLVCLAVLAADLLLWEAPLGLGAALLAVAVAAILSLRVRPTPAAWLCAGGAGLLLLIDPGPLALAGALLLCTAAGLIARGWRPADPWAVAVGVAGGMLRALPRVGGDLRALRRLRRTAGRRSGWLLPALGALGFLVLFGIGNPVIASWWSRLGDWLIAIGLPVPSRIVFWWLAAIAFGLLARSRARQLAVDSAGGPTREPAMDGTVRCLAAFNLVFLLQNGCDLFYLWGGAGLPEGMTYAGYAHRGAYPLVAAALLAGAFVLLCVRPGGAAERSRLARWLVFAFLAQTVVLTASSWWRLDLYVDVYGLTRWRLATLLWMGLVGLGLLFIALRIWWRRSGRWLLGMNAWAVVAVLAVAALGDGDGLIARHNVRRALADPAGCPLDLSYTASLGPAALPALSAFATASRRPDAGQAVEALRLQVRRELGDWRGWTWRRWQVSRQMAGRQP